MTPRHIFTHKETARLCECYYNKCFSKDLTAEQFDYQGHANEIISVCLSSVSSCELLRGSILTLSDDSEKFKRHSTVETCLVPVAKYPAKSTLREKEFVYGGEAGGQEQEGAGCVASSQEAESGGCCAQLALSAV